MKSLSSVGLGLSIVFGCLLLALVAELYYLLWWKKRFVSRDIENDYSNPAREFFCMFCWKRASSSLSHKALNPQEIRIRDSLAQETEHSNRNLLLKPFDDDGLETELTGLHPFPGPPRFLFTIVEETKEDLESEDGKSRKASRGRSLSDILLKVETPYLTPFASPPFFTPPLTPMSMDSSYSHSHTHQQGFNPLFESVTDAEFNRIRSSPPPRFKFLQDAEEKLHRRKLMEETAKNDELVQEDGSRSSCSSLLKDEEEGSFITIIVDRNNERGFLHQNHQHPQFHSSTSQVLPLSSSPSKFQPPVTNKLK